MIIYLLKVSICMSEPSDEAIRPAFAFRFVPLGLVEVECQHCIDHHDLILESHFFAFPDQVIPKSCVLEPLDQTWLFSSF
jgi:hypothetical protein